MTSKDRRFEDEYEDDSVKVTNLMPMTIRQIKSSSQLHSEAPFFYKDREVNNILLVAIVDYIRADPSLITLRLDDSTSGFIYGRKHLDNCDLGRQDEPLGGITEGMYVRVWAKLTSDDNGTSLMVEEVRPVTDRHELLYHVFNVALAHSAHGLESDGYLTGSEWEFVDLEEYETKDKNDRDMSDSLVNTRSAPEPGPAPGAEAEAGSLAHFSNLHLDAGTGFDGYGSSDVPREREGGGKPKLESGSGSGATAMGGNDYPVTCGYP